MSFITEKAPQEIIEKYNLQKLGKTYWTGNFRYWTVSDEKKSFLLYINSDREDVGVAGVSHYIFYWNSLWIEVDTSIEYKNNDLSQEFYEISLVSARSVYWDEYGRSLLMEEQSFRSEDFFQRLKEALTSHNAYWDNKNNSVLSFKDFS